MGVGVGGDGASGDAMTKSRAMIILHTTEARCGLTAPHAPMAAKKKPDSSTIALNRKARFDYFIEQEFEAGLVLQGWEVKSLRDGRAQLKESYVVVLRGEIFLIGAHVSPLRSTSTHIRADPVRSRKLLLHKKEISKLIGASERDGYTIVALSLYWRGGRAKAKIALVRGKKQYDKRHVIKQREWNRDKQRLLKVG